MIIVISSFPRSGTHFLIDFIRRNFPDFNVALPPWQSSEGLYYNLDRELPRHQSWSTSVLRQKNFIVKTHELPFEQSLATSLEKLGQTHECVTLTPVRPLAKSLASYAAYAQITFDKSTPADTPDPYYPQGKTVEDTLLAFYKYTIPTAVLVDVESGLRRPEDLARELGKVIGHTPAALRHRRLPPRRKSHGLAGEITSRIIGRPSSEVVVPKENPAGRQEIKLSPRLQQLDNDLQARFAESLTSTPEKHQSKYPDLNAVLSRP